MTEYLIDKEIKLLSKELLLEKSLELNTYTYFNQTNADIFISQITKQLSTVKHIDILFTEHLTLDKFAHNLFQRIIIKLWGLKNKNEDTLSSLTAVYDQYNDTLSTIETDYLESLNLQPKKIEIPKTNDYNEFKRQLERKSLLSRNFYLNLFTAIYAPMSNTFTNRTGYKNNLNYSGANIINLAIGSQTFLFANLFLLFLKEESKKSPSMYKLIYSIHAFLHTYNITMSTSISNFYLNLNNMNKYSIFEKKTINRLSYFSEQFSLPISFNDIINNFSNKYPHYGRYTLDNNAHYYIFSEDGLNILEFLLNELQYHLIPSITKSITTQLFDLDSLALEKYVDINQLDYIDYPIVYFSENTTYIRDLQDSYKIRDYIIMQDRKKFNDYKLKKVKKDPSIPPSEDQCIDDILKKPHFTIKF